MKAIDWFKKKKFDFVVGVPCSNIKDFIEDIIKNPKFRYIPCPREDFALGMCFGAYLAGKKSLCYLQNSGLFNCGDVICSLIKLYGAQNHIHLLISNRIKPIQHKEIGEKIKEWLKLMGWKNYTLVEQK